MSNATAEQLQFVIHFDDNGTVIGEDWSSTPQPEVEDRLIQAARTVLNETRGDDNSDTYTVMLTEEAEGLVVSVEGFKDGEEDPDFEAESVITL